jgi:hypothetical protein
MLWFDRRENNCLLGWAPSTFYYGSIKRTLGVQYAQWVVRIFAIQYFRFKYNINTRSTREDPARLHRLVPSTNNMTAMG